jgi:hypothetical protein
MGRAAETILSVVTPCPFSAIRVDSRVPVDVRLASIFGQAPRHSQAVVNPLEGVRLRNLGSIAPAADHAGRKAVRQIPFRLSQATTKPGIRASLKLFAKPIISSRD